MTEFFAIPTDPSLPAIQTTTAHSRDKVANNMFGGAWSPSDVAPKGDRRCISPFDNPEVGRIIADRIVSADYSDVPENRRLRTMYMAFTNAGGGNLAEAPGAIEGAQARRARARV